MKKIIGIMLIGVLCFSMSVGSFATNDPNMLSSYSARLGGGDSHIIINTKVECINISSSDLDDMSADVLELCDAGTPVEDFMEVVSMIGSYCLSGKYGNPVVVVSSPFAAKKSNRENYIADYARFEKDVERFLRYNDSAHIYQKYVMYEDEGEWTVEDAPGFFSRWCPACEH